METKIEKIQKEVEFRKEIRGFDNEKTVADAIELIDMCKAKSLTVQEATDSLELAIKILPMIANC